MIEEDRCNVVVIFAASLLHIIGLKYLTSEESRNNLAYSGHSEGLYIFNYLLLISDSLVHSVQLRVRHDDMCFRIENINDAFWMLKEGQKFLSLIWKK